MITGSKQWITNGSHADTFVLFARSDQSTAGPRGISCFLLDRDHVTVVREEEKLGLNSSSTADIRVDGVRVGSDRLLHEERKGFTVAMATLDGGRIGIAAQAVGIAQAAFDTARAYAAQRRQFGRRIAEFQAIQFALAEMATSIDAARLLTYRAAWRKQAGPAAHRGGREGEAVRLAGRGRDELERDPGARRLRVHEGVPRRAVLPRREGDRDLRGHVGDPAHRHRPPDPAAPGASAARRRGRDADGVLRLAPVATRLFTGPRSTIRPWHARKDEPVRLTRIYTRGGDAGETSLGDGSRVSKLDARIVAYGTVDELNAQLGVVLTADCPEPLRETLRGCRTSSSTSAPTSACRRAVEGRLRIEQAAVDALEADCDRFNEDLPELRSFVLPGGTAAAAALHVARTVCRRAERETLVAAARARRQPALRGVPEPPLRPAVHPRARRERARRRGRAALEAWRLALAFGGSFVAGAAGSALGLVLGTLRLPMILLAAGDPTAGAGTNIAISAAAAGSGGLRHAREGRVDWRVVAVMAPPSIVGAVLGALAVRRRPDARPLRRDRGRAPLERRRPRAASGHAEAAGTPPSRPRSRLRRR